MRNKSLALCILACAVIAASCPPLVALAADENSVSSVEAALANRRAGLSEDEYRFAEEDIIQLDVWGEPELTKLQMQVTPDGKVNIAYLGEMQVAGLTRTELTDRIAKKFEEEGILINPKVQLTIIKMHEPTARVLGEVQRPGAIIFKDGDTILDAVAQAGSYTDNAMLEKATITPKNSDISVPIDLKKMLHGDLTQNYPLQKGDTIYIPPEDYQNKIYVFGQVLKPGIYALKDKTTVLSAISLAGGPTQRGALRSTIIVRGDPAKPERVACDLTKLFDKADLSQDIPLQPGDAVIVPETKRPDWSIISQVLNAITSISYIRRLGIF